MEAPAGEPLHLTSLAALSRLHSPGPDQGQTQAQSQSQTQTQTQAQTQGQAQAQPQAHTQAHSHSQGPGQLYTAFASLRQVREARTRGGEPFLDLVLADCSATARAKIWAGSPALASTRALGAAARATGVKALFHAEEFQGCLQLNIRNLRPAVDGEPGYDATVVFGAGWPLVRDLACRTLVFDIETVPAVERRSLPTTVAESLARAAERFDSDEAKVMGLSPYFGKVVSLAVADADEVDDAPPREAEAGRQGGEGGERARGGETRVTAFVVPNPEAPSAPLPAWVRPVSEPELLEAWWALAGVADTVVSFNGRGFDVPFLVVRSLLQGIPARVDLLGNRYGLRPHLDLHRALTSGERVHGPANLDVLCWALGLESPKGEMDGSMVAPAYARGELARIAEYNARDVRATAAVYRAVRDRVLRFRDDW